MSSVVMINLAWEEAPARRISLPCGGQPSLPDSSEPPPASSGAAWAQSEGEAAAHGEASAVESRIE